IAPIVNEPSIVGAMLGVRLRGNWVSRANPVPRWEKLVKEGVVVRSDQMKYSQPMPVLTPADRTRAIQQQVGERCPATDTVNSTVDARLATERTPPAGSSLADDSRAMASLIVGDSRVRQRLGPLMQTPQTPLYNPPASCASELRSLLSYDDIERRVAA